MKALLYIRKGSEASTGAICDSAICRQRDPFFVPDDRTWLGIPLVGVRIDRLGKNIRHNFAEKYYTDTVTAVHAYTEEAEDTASRWARDCALTVSDPGKKDDMAPEVKNLIDRMISVFSFSSTLKTGDLILVGLAENTFRIPKENTDINIEAADGFPPITFKVR